MTVVLVICAEVGLSNEELKQSLGISARRWAGYVQTKFVVLVLRLQGRHGCA